MDFARMPIAGRWPFLRLGAVPGEAWEAGERPNQRIDKLLFSGETPLRTVNSGPGLFGLWRNPRHRNQIHQKAF
jgi:hypothetical protein